MRPSPRNRNLQAFLASSELFWQFFDNIELEYPSTYSIYDRTSQMRKLRRRRCLELFVVVAAMALIAVAPSGALAAGEESSGGSTTGETGTESSSGSTETAPPPAPEEASSTATPPASTGWVPQGEGTDAPSHGAASTRRGSSLGSGANPKQPGSTSEGAGSTGEGSSYSGGSSGYSEPASSTPSTFEESASKPRAVSPPVGTVQQPQVAEATPDKSGRAAVGASIPVALPDPPRVADTSSARLAASIVGTRDRVASGSGSLPLPVLIVGLLILVYAGARLLLGPVEPDLFRSGPLQRVRRALSRV
jgi:hypothetical protein